MTPIRVLVVEDEPAARRGIRVLLEKRHDLTLVGEAGNVKDARVRIDETKPDVVLLDVRMPGGTGLDAVREQGPLPVVVLITAHEEHALEAFEVEAVDYLLKPFSDAEFERALDRACRQVDRIRAAEVGDRLAALFSELPRAGEHTRGPSAERIAVRRGERVVLVDPGDVLWADAEGDYVRLHTADKAHVVRTTMRALADRLGDRFFRIHRSTLVRLDHIHEIQPRGGGRYTVILGTGERRNISPRRYEELQNRLGL